MWLLLLSALVAVSASAGNNCRGTANTLPLETQTPKFVRAVKNGALYTVDSVSPSLLVAHIWGAPGRERGLAYGALLKPVLRSVHNAFMAWVEASIEETVDKYVPKDVAELVAIYGLDVVLDLQYDLMRNHMSHAFIEEVKGVAEAGGLTFKELMRVQMFPELVKAHCSMVGAWGEATAPAFRDSLIQLRALDWATDSPLQQWPLVTVIHTSEQDAFATLSWPLFLGALTGMSSRPVGICEKVYLAYNGTDRRNGIPFTLLLRDILEFDGSVDAALQRMQAAKRTCSVWIGVGSPTSPARFTVVEYARDYVRHFNDSSLEKSNPQHPQLIDVVYVDKHVQPSHDPCLGSLLQAAHGSLTPAALVAVASQLQTGDTHAAVYDYLNMRMLVANASPWINNTFVPAYDRRWVQLDMAALFAQTQ